MANLELKSTIGLETFARTLQEVLAQYKGQEMTPEKRKGAVLEAYYRIVLASTDDEGRAKALGLLLKKRLEARANGFDGISPIPGSSLVRPAKRLFKA